VSFECDRESFTVFHSFFTGNPTEGLHPELLQRPIAAKREHDRGPFAAKGKHEELKELKS
jgi:hypothetical protein